MDGAAIGGIIGCAFAVIVNVSFFAYGYGKLSQKVSDMCSRLTRIEKIMNGDIDEG